MSGVGASYWPSSSMCPPQIVCLAAGEMAVARKYAPKMESWQMETWTKTCVTPGPWWFNFDPYPCGVPLPRSCLLDTFGSHSTGPDSEPLQEKICQQVGRANQSKPKFTVVGQVWCQNSKAREDTQKTHCGQPRMRSSMHVNSRRRTCERPAKVDFTNPLFQIVIDPEVRCKALPIDSTLCKLILQPPIWGRSRSLRFDCVQFGIPNAAGGHTWRAHFLKGPFTYPAMWIKSFW